MIIASLKWPIWELQILVLHGFVFLPLRLGFLFFVCILFACLFWLMLIVRAGCSSERHGYAHNTLNSYIVK